MRADPYPALARIRGRLELTEPLGREVILNVRINGKRIFAKLYRRSQASAGDKIGLYFDSETGDRTEWGANGRTKWLAQLLFKKRLDPMPFKKSNEVRSF